MTMVERVGQYRAGFGESPFWSTADGAVWWVDLHGRALLRTHDDGTTWVFKTPGFPANNPRAVAPGRDGKLIVALDDRLTRFDPATGAFTDIEIALPVPIGHVLNDATVDLHGGLLISTVRASGGGDHRAMIFLVTPRRCVHVVAEGLCTPNGLALSPDGKTIYFADSHRDIRTVWQAAYNGGAEGIASRSTFVSADRFPGRPDGAAMDRDGGYWIASLETGQVLRFTPGGEMSARVRLPVSMPSKPCFGGAQLDVLYITTAGPLGGVDDGRSGALFRAFAGVEGLAASRCNL